MSKLMKFKINKSTKYIHIDQTNINDLNLSWKAKGIFTYIISRPDDWEIRANDLLQKSADSKASLYSGIKELVTFKYIYRAVKRDNLMRIMDWKYFVFEEPIEEIEAKEIIEENGYQLFQSHLLETKKWKTNKLEIGMYRSKESIIDNCISKESLDTEEVSKDIKSSVPEEQTNLNSDNNGFGIPIIPEIRKNKSSIEIINKPHSYTYKKEIIEIINYWNSSPGIPHIHIPSIIKGEYINPTKTFMNTIDTITKVMNGTFFVLCGLVEDNCIYDKDIIIKTIDKYKLIATNPSYYPFDKRCFKNINLNSFFFNMYSLNIQSQFLLCLREEPKLILNSVSLESEKNKQLTIWLKEAYNKKLNWGNRKFTKLEELKFIKGANFLHDTIQVLQSKLNMMTRPIEWAYYTIDALIDNWREEEVLPGHIASEYTYNTILPKFMKKKGRIE